MADTKCSCVILNYNDATTTVELIRHIYKYANINKIVVVDNCSTDDSLEILQFYKDEKVIVISSEKNNGYGAGNNEGVRYVHEVIGDSYALIANPDIHFSDESIKKMMETFSSSQDICVVATKQKNIEGKYIKDIAWKIPTKFELGAMDTRLFRIKMHEKSRYSDQYLEKGKYAFVDCVPGAMLMVDTKKFINIGGYDENMFLYCEEILLGIKLKKAGYKTILLTDESYLHVHSVSINKSIQSKIKQYQMIVENRIYLMKNYYQANFIEVALTKLIYSIIVIERKIIAKIK